MVANLLIGDKRYVVLEEEEYFRLLGEVEVPPLPEPNREGNYSAVPAARAVIARGIILDRASMGLSQKALAELAGVRVETLNRIEKARVTPDMATIIKIDQALERARARAGRSARRAPAKRSRPR